MRAPARAEKSDADFTAAADAIALWGFKFRYDECMGGIRKQILDAIDAIEGADADIRLIPRAVAHLKSQAKLFKNTAYARSIILSAIQERAWEAVVAPQRAETPQERAARQMRENAAKIAAGVPL